MSHSSTPHEDYRTPVFSDDDYGSFYESWYWLAICLAGAAAILATIFFALNALSK